MIKGFYVDSEVNPRYTTTQVPPDSMLQMRTGDQRDVTLIPGYKVIWLPQTSKQKIKNTKKDKWSIACYDKFGINTYFDDAWYYIVILHTNTG